MKKTPLLQRRRSGILMPIFSLPSPYGIGTLGKSAYDFVDFLKKAGQSYWQILPLGPTTFGDSPYQAYSTFAGNPYFIDLETLCKDGYLTKAECDAIDFGKDPTDIDYEKLYQGRLKLMRIAQTRFFANIPADYDEFCKKNAFWLKDYALFMAIKYENKGASFDRWEEGLRLRKRADMMKASRRLKSEIDLWKMQQYLFFKQWTALKAYANENGISIIGDLPIYVACDSADVWASPDQFVLDENCKPTQVAGCPPDAFTADGQLWGNPLYRWDKMKEDGYAWWCRRMKAASTLYDVVRLDHFRGFEAYYTIPAGRKNARRGKWQKGPGMELFETFRKKIGDIPIIAEDLGFLTPAVHQMLADSGYPGMKVAQFAFDNPAYESEYLPHTYPKNCVAYAGTHDNETIIGWLDNAKEATVKHATAYFRLTEKEGRAWGVIRGMMASTANTVIFQIQDFIGLGNEARINEPSTLGKNWRWRIRPECINDWLAELIFKSTKTYYRTPNEIKNEN
ncbi:MAG: 4-alpha-glucanotransferase [Clostridia bacterium]|nr:4-alpha-glucanotransferase [Clostridia bacterium]